MKMVVTLRSGVQIRVDVTALSTGPDPLGDLRPWRWTSPKDAGTVLRWVDPHEVVAVHAEYETGE